MSWRERGRDKERGEILGVFGVVLKKKYRTPGSKPGRRDG